MQNLENHIASVQQNPIRLQEYAVGIFQKLSTRSAVKKALKKELILVNGVPGSTAQFIKGGEEITLLQAEKVHKPFDLKLEIIFEDDFLAVINKPAGISVSGNSYQTIDNALEQNISLSNQQDAVRPRPVHRLDNPTSGLLLIGKTASSIQLLNKLFENKEIQKTYHAIAIGKMKEVHKMTLPIDGKEAITTYQRLSFQSSNRFGMLNLVELTPKTGRKHQLRKHLYSLGNPILGDKEYFIQGHILKGKGLYLHASKLVFVHPFTSKELIVQSSLPKKFLKIFPEKSF